MGYYVESESGSENVWPRKVGIQGCFVTVVDWASDYILLERGGVVSMTKSDEWEDVRID